MSSTSHKSFASRLGNAKKFKTIVTSFSNYQAPIESASIEALSLTINSIEALQEHYDTVKTDYKIKTNARQKLFSGNIDAIDKRLSPISAFVKALKGKDSVELKQITGLIYKIRGTTKRKKVNVSQEDSDSISQIERTYASRISNFKSIIVVLNSLGEIYNPPNPLISLVSLNELAVAAEHSTASVDECLSVLNPLVVERKDVFNALKDQVQGIKNFIKAQFGPSSNEFKQISKLAA